MSISDLQGHFSRPSMTTADPSLSTLLHATISRTELLEKLELAALVKPLRLLAFGALLEAREGSLVITCDNLEVLVRVEVPAKVENEGSTTLSAERLRKLLDNADGDEVILRGKDGTSIEVTCDKLAASLASGPVFDFPCRPVNPVQATFEIGTSKLKAALKWLEPAAPDDSQHPGIHFIGDGKTLRLESIDGRQLHCVTIASSATVNAIAPAALIKLAKAFEVDGEECTVEVTERSISFRTGKIFVCSSRLEGKFPDTSQVIPEPSDKVFILPKAALESALLAAGAVLEKNFGPRHVNFSVKADATTIRTSRCTPGTVESVIETSNLFEIDFQIDPFRLLDVLKLLDGDAVAIQIDDPLRSAGIREDDKLAIIATMRVEP